MVIEISNKRKTGVSLITVLLFMLIATIAATATWKWITSESRSSASRMLQREAYQSSIAGIENARAWMTYHASDIGGIVTQYLKQKRPVRLTPVLQPLAKAGQTYEVWLTGVHVENSSYKIQILSSGEARNGSRHSEVAILNVTGLYQVNVPADNEAIPAPPIPNYFGGTTVNHGNIFAKSMIINGNLVGGNPASIDEDLIVTGDFKVSGNSIAVNGNACIGGNLDANNGIVGNSFYVNGNLSNLIIRPLTATQNGSTINLGDQIYGDLYVNGDIEQANGNQDIAGNLTLNGTWTTNLSGYTASVGGDLCVGPSGQINFPNMSRTFQGGGNVWMESTYPLWTGTENADNASKISIGSEGKLVYIKTAHPLSDYSSMLQGNTEETKNFKQTKDANKPRACLGGYAYRYAAPAGLHLCDSDGSHIDNGWDDQDYKPYKNAPSGENLFYLYYMPPGTTDVGFGTYEDPYWQWCTDFRESHILQEKRCYSYKNSSTITGYFINFTEKSKAYAFTNSGHTNSDGMHPVNIAGKGHYRYLNHNGTSVTGSPYCILNPDGNKFWQPQCGVAPWFTVAGDFQTIFPPERPESIACAESVKEYCENILGTPTTGCDATNYIVPDILKTGISSFSTKANNTTCVTKLLALDKNNFDFNQFNTCYDEAPESSLYNGYLVVRVSDKNIFTSSTGTLSRNFIFIFDRDLKDQVKLPPTSPGKYTFLYFAEGLSGTLQPTTSTGEYDYFIYTKKNISNVLFNDTPLKGAIYAAVADETSGAKNCASVGDMTFNKGIEFNEELLNSLSQAKILCDANASTCGGTTSSSSSSIPASSSSSILDEENGFDTFHIAAAPQLGISLESQRIAAKSEIPTTDHFDPIVSSVLVLPRVIYLTRDPIGKLSDYYNVINLNGATEVKEASKVTCSSGAINTIGLLYQDGNKLPEGLHTCTYKSTQYEDNKFYLYVSGLAGGAPPVSFTTDKAEVTAGGAPVTVSLDLPKSNHGNIEVDVLVSSIPAGWTVTPQAGVQAREGASGAIYKVTATLSSAAASVKPIFTVSPGPNAVNGGVNFQLITPCEGCTIGSPSSEYVFMTGYADFVKKTLSEYCGTYPEECAANGYASKADLPDCDNIISGEWIKARGLNCRTKTTNHSWACGTNSSVSLVGASSAPSYCELIIPTANNVITQAENGQTYYLYASLKRKVYTFTVNKEGAQSNDTKIKVYFSPNGVFSSTADEECSENTCTYSIYAGYYAKVEYEEGTNDNFAYWSCTGTNCPSTNGVHSISYTLPKVTGNNSVTAKFNDPDKHCFYEDFANLGSFCTGDDTHCIANCANNHCSISSSTTVDWMLIYGNHGNGNGSNVAPVINTSEGSISQGNVGGDNKNNSNGRQTLVLSSKDAGANGTMSAFVTVPISQKNANATINEFLNSGLIFRSNSDATDYSILNLYGLSNGTLRIRVCKENGQGTNNANGCMERNFSNLNVSSNTHAAIRMTLNDNTLTAVVTIDGQTETIVLNIAGYSNTANKYVGMKMSDDAFSLYDIGWESASYPNEGCWSVPTVHCSFKANYLGGIVPQNTDVTPWINLSSWFSENNCTPDYYYTGNDNASAQTSDDTYGHHLNSSIYNFSEEGTHGPDNKDALVTMTCPQGVSTSLGNDAKSCGSFWVGDVVHCSQNYSSLLNTEYYASASENEISVSTDGINMREATLFVEIADLTIQKQVTIRLKDADGHYSLPSTMTSNTTHSLSIDIMSNIEGFNPEQVVAIVVSSDVSFTVKSARTTCPYALSISNCSATYNGTSWIISSTINNIDGAKPNGCTILTQNSDIDVSDFSGITCPEDGTFSIPDADFFTRLNVGSSTQEVSFTIKALNLQEEELTCEATTSYSPINITCSVASETAIQGQGVPSLSYSISNCPSSGCPYTLSLSTTPAMTSEGTQTGGNDTWTPAVNTTTALNTASYTYSIEAMGKSEDCGSFTVSAPSPAAVTSCSISEGQFTALITPANDGSAWSATIAVTDALGNTVTGSTQSISSSTASSWTVDLPSIKALATDATYYVNMTLNGTAVTDCAPTWTVEGTGSSGPDALSLSNCPATATETSVEFTPTIAGCSGGSTCSWSVNNSATVTEGTDGKITISEASAGITYTLTLTRGTSSDTDYATASCEIRFTSTTPSFDVQCNSGSGNTIANQTNVTQGSTVTVTPYQVSGCNSDCSYDISLNGSSILSTPQSSYDGSSINFTGASSSGKKDYTLTIYDPTSSDSKSCTFSVTYADGGTDICHCEDYCGNGCKDNITTTNIDNSSFNGCLFFTSVSKLHFNNGYKINNVDKSGQLCWDDPAKCESALSSIDRVDGGYYLKVNDWGYVTITETYNPCKAEELPTIVCQSTRKAIASRTTNISITSLTNCDTKNGCSFTVKDETETVASGNIKSAGRISIPGATGTKSYVVTVTNSVSQSASCNTSVAYVSGTTVNAKGKTYNIEFTQGNCYIVKINTGGVWRCTTPSQQASDVVIGEFNGSIMTINQWQTQSNTITSPGKNTEAAFCVDESAPPISCDTDYY